MICEIFSGWRITSAFFQARLFGTRVRLWQISPVFTPVGGADPTAGVVTLDEFCYMSSYYDSILIKEFVENGEEKDSNHAKFQFKLGTRSLHQATLGSGPSDYRYELNLNLMN